MQSGFNEKIAYKYTPCKAPGPCYDYDDYDPCESSDDITEKDLAVLLKEERLKLEKQAAEKQAAEKLITDATFEKQTTEEKTLADAASALNAAQGAQNPPVCKPGDKTAVKPTEEDVEEKAARKRNCKKFIKNPFFTNRFKFSSDFPPPPPGPPEQFLPLLEEVSSKDRLACLKRRRKCGKKTSDGKDGKGGKDSSKGAGIGEDDMMDSELRDLDSDENGKSFSPKSKSSSNAEDSDRSAEEDQFDTNLIFKDDDNGKTDDKNKRCAKKSEKFPCRKKDAEIPITLQPRQIPAAQKDLPETSPLRSPEVRRQLKMSCHYECRPLSSKKKCKDNNNK